MTTAHDEADLPMKKFYAFAAVLLVALVGAGAYAWITRTEEIPEQLDAMEEPAASVVIPGRGEQPPLDLSARRGKTTAFVVIGTWSARNPEGEDTNRALSRWSFPEETDVFVIADVAGLAVFSDRIESTLGSYANELKFPLYLDYQGTFIQTFKLPKGHHGLVVLDPAGNVVVRHSGGLEGAALEELRTQLGASEPEPGPSIPAFEIPGLSAADCGEKACAFIYSGAKPITRADIPRIGEGQFEGDEDALLAHMLLPEVRNVTLARKMKLSDQHGHGVLLGDVAEDIDTTGWLRLGMDETADVRRALGLGDEPAIVVFEHGREAVRATGLAPLYIWGRVADLLGVEKFNDRRPPRG